MKTILLFALASLCLTYAHVARSAGPAGCSLKALASVDLVLGEDVLVPVTVQNRKAWMSLNTKAALSLVRSTAISDLNLPTKTVSPKRLGIDVNKNSVTQLAEFGPIAIGDVRIPRRLLLVNPNPASTASIDENPIVGSLGMDVLWPFDFELDLAHKKFAIYSQEHCPGHVVSWSDNYAQIPMELSELGNVYFPVELDGRRINTSISATDLGTTLTSDAARRVFGLNAHSPNIEVQEDSAGHRKTYYQSKKLTSGALAFTDITIKIVPPSKDCKLVGFDGSDTTARYELCFGVYPLVLGRDVLEKLHLYFATREKVIYFTETVGASTSISASELSLDQVQSAK
jgi:hypothetical protein